MEKFSSSFLNYSNEELKRKTREAQKLSWLNFGKKLKIYYPSLKFPTISITGTSCEQNCLYCNKYYLKQMIAISTPKKLLAFAKKLEKKGGTGFLISGGFNDDLILPIEPFLETILEIKNTTHLKINIHPGLINKEQAKAIYNVKVDTISFDLVTDNQIIEEILRNGYKGDDYLRTYDTMISTGLNVIPHICLGLFYGSEKGNIEAINAALKRKPKQLVFLGMIPTKNTPMENTITINPEVFLKILVYTRLNNPRVELSLGCMRVRLPIFEEYALQAGINRIAIPKKETINYARQVFDLEIERIDSCCAV